MQKSIERAYRGPRNFASVTMSAADIETYGLRALGNLGIDIRNNDVRGMFHHLVAAMDTNDVGIAPAPLNGITTPSIPGLIQFLQAWLPGFVRALTAARKIDDLIGISTIGSFEDEEVIQGIVEPLGVAVPYTDHGNVPLSNWNANWERRTVVRFEQGMEVGYLEDLRAARVRINTAGEKRTSAAEGLDIQRNRVGFYGYNSGNNRTYGFLNEPGLPAYVNLPNGASGFPDWARKTFLEITADIRTSLQLLRTQSLDRIDPKKTPITLAIASEAVDYLSVTSEFGNSVQDWLTKTYPNVRVESAPELDDANGGVGVFYLFAETVSDSGTDDNRTWVQAVPTKFITLGVDKRAKTYVEDYANATAGVMLKRPYAVIRRSGVSV